MLLLEERDKDTVKEIHISSNRIINSHTRSIVRLFIKIEIMTNNSLISSHIPIRIKNLLRKVNTCNNMIIIEVDTKINKDITRIMTNSKTTQNPQVLKMLPIIKIKVNNRNLNKETITKEKRNQQKPPIKRISLHLNSNCSKNNQANYFRISLMG